MASLFSHALVAVTAARVFSAAPGRSLWLPGIACSLLPDADVLAFRLGIPYGAVWGHRGFTHSLFFAALVGITLGTLLSRRQDRGGEWFRLVCYFFLCTASHGLLDAMTSGGLGVAFFAPWVPTRYFLPWRPILVSPLEVEAFFGAYGVRVILSELVWIGLPCALLWIWLSRKGAENPPGDSFR